MENLRRVIEILFSKMNPEKIIQSNLNWSSKDLTIDILKDDFLDIAETLDNSHSRNELEYIFDMVEAKWCYADNPIPDNLRHNVFYTLLAFANEILIEENERPVCEFAQLLRWRDLSYKLGEDIFSTSFFAYKDLSSKRERHYFAWGPTINTNNHYLKEITRKGLTDLHFHLFGSSLNFDITWLSLMNDIRNRKKDFDMLNKSKSPEMRIYSSEQGMSLYALYIKAFVIRILLFTVLTKNFDREKKDNVDEFAKIWKNTYIAVLAAKTEEELKIYIPTLQKYVDLFKALHGRKYNKKCVDYAIRKNLSEKNYEESSFLNVILTGERWMMYKVFSKIFSEKDEISSIRPLFYAYLIIKSKIRKELIQVNTNPGFYNFQEYQNRKLVFVKPNSVYSQLIVNLSVSNMLYNQNVDYLEARVAPRNSVLANCHFVKDLDMVISLPEFCTSNIRDLESPKRNDTDRYYYIFHFLKHDRDFGQKIDEITSVVKPRHSDLRRCVKEQAMSINIIRKYSVSISNRIVGIDAAGTEIGYRPEIFAQAYRYLKFYSYENNDYILSVNQRYPLGFTYHVGEDFLDISDGLRAIDEVIRFLKFGRGDRIGHGLVLGLDPFMYYNKRKKKHIILPKLDYLDNVVWLLTQIKKYNLSVSQVLILQLKDDYWRLLNEIYDQQISFGVDCRYEDRAVAITSIQPDIYFQSWLLRGDNPYLYFDSNILNNQNNFNPITFWERCGLNEGKEFFVARNNIIARALYKAYHFSDKVKSNGAKVDEFPISPEYIQLIFDLQKAMRIELSEKHIAVEVNPTSNKLIGAYSLYSEHPLTKFFNLKLVNDYREIEQCPQLSASINTDDLGVFATNLENEYALMAIALEKEKNEDGTPKYASRLIYNWLESIRQMGLEQRFVKIDNHNRR